METYVQNFCGKVALEHLLLPPQERGIHAARGSLPALWRIALVILTLPYVEANTRRWTGAHRRGARAAAAAGVAAARGDPSRYAALRIRRRQALAAHP